jgi:hypothetical protein
MISPNSLHAPQGIPFSGMSVSRIHIVAAAADRSMNAPADRPHEAGCSNLTPCESEIWRFSGFAKLASAQLRKRLVAGLALEFGNLGPRQAVIDAPAAWRAGA